MLFQQSLGQNVEPLGRVFLVGGWQHRYVMAMSKRMTNPPKATTCQYSKLIRAIWSIWSICIHWIIGDIGYPSLDSAASMTPAMLRDSLRHGSPSQGAPAVRHRGSRAADEKHSESAKYCQGRAYMSSPYGYGSNLGHHFGQINDWSCYRCLCPSQKGRQQPWAIAQN